MYNPNWNRWVEASINDHVKVALPSLQLYFEGMTRAKPELERVEVRIDGPVIFQEQRQHVLEFEINLLICSYIDKDDHYKHVRLVGEASAAITKCIPVFKKGSGLLDTGDKISILMTKPLTRGDRAVKVSKFGIIEPTTRMMQSVVEGHYSGEFTDEA